MDDYSEPICAECESGGALLCCDGVCNRSFHTECLGEEPEDDGEPWLCFDCAHEVHRCFACKHYAATADLVQCAEVNCRKMFHRTVECAGKPLVEGERFVCPLHKCKKCNAASGVEADIVRCFRCPTAYCRDCCPLDVHTLEDSIFICIHHVQVRAACVPPGPHPPPSKHHPTQPKPNPNPTRARARALLQR